MEIKYYIENNIIFAREIGSDSLLLKFYKLKNGIINMHMFLVYFAEIIVCEVICEKHFIRKKNSNVGCELVGDTYICIDDSVDDIFFLTKEYFESNYEEV